MGEVTLSGATVTITPVCHGDYRSGGGTFNPTSVTLDDSTTSATFTYTPSSSGPKIIATTNVISTGGSLDNPESVTYTATVGAIADSYTFTGPITAPIDHLSGPFTITPTVTPWLQSDGTYNSEAKTSGTITIRITDSRDSSYIDYPFADSSTPQTFTVTATGNPNDQFTLTPSCTGLSNPAALTVTAQTYSEQTTAGTLSTAYTYYRLTSDITVDATAFSITEDHITLDLNGYTVLYDNDTPINEIPNAGFETGDFTDWTLTGPAIPEIVASVPGFWGKYAAKISGTIFNQTLASQPVAIPTANIPYIAIVQTTGYTNGGTVLLEVWDSTPTRIAFGSGYGNSNPWGPVAGGATMVEFTPSTANDVHVKIVLTNGDGMSGVPWSVLDGDQNATELLNGIVNQSVPPSGTTVNGRPFTTITTASPSDTSLTLKLFGGTSDADHYIYADAALIEGPGSYSNVVDNSDPNFGSVDNATTWTLSTSKTARYGANYCYLAGGGTGTQYCYWKFTGLTANTTYTIALTWPTPDLTSIMLDHPRISRRGQTSDNNATISIHGVTTGKEGICITSSTAGGTGASAGAVTFDADGAIIAIAVGNPGSGYTTPPFVFITNGATDSYGTGATATASIDGSGHVTGFTIVHGGSGYAEAVVHIISGGAIIQGQARSHAAHPIRFLSCTGLQVDNISVYGYGSDVEVICIDYCDDCSVLNSHLVAGLDLIVNRMKGHGIIWDAEEANGSINTRRYENNILAGQHENGIAHSTRSDSVSIKNNRIYHNSAWTDGYGIGGNYWKNFEVAYNTIIPCSGRGILLNGTYGYIDTGIIHHNYIDVQERYNPAYGPYGLTATGIRLRNDNVQFVNFTISDNVVYAHTGKINQVFDACAIRYMLKDNNGSCQNSGMVVENNLFKAIVTDYDSTLDSQNAMAMDFGCLPEKIGIAIRNNVLESNCTSLSIGSNDANGATRPGEFDQSFITNTFKKSNDGLAVVRCRNDRRTRSHMSVVAGAYGLPVQNIRLINTQYLNGAATVGGTPDGLELFGDSTNEISTGWLCNVTVYQYGGILLADGAIVTVTDANSNQYLPYTADNNGVVTGIEILTTTYTLSQYLNNPENPYADDTGDPPGHRHRTQNNPFTFTATWNGNSATPVVHEFTGNDSISLIMTS